MSRPLCRRTQTRVHPVLLSQILALPLLLVAPLSAQDPRQEQQQRPTWTTIKESGLVHSVDRGLVRMVSHKGERWQIKVTGSTKVTLHGEVGPEALRVGTPVRFYADLDRRGNARDKIEQLTIFSPTADFMPMAELQQDPLPLGGQSIGPAGAAPGRGEGEKDGAEKDGAEKEDAEKERAENEDGEEDGAKRERADVNDAAEEGGAGDSSQSENAEGSQAENETPSRPPRSTTPRSTTRRAGRTSRAVSAKQAAAAATKRYFISGVIRRVQRDKIIVGVDQGRSVTARVDKNARVRIDSQDYTLARPRCPINVVARYYYKPGQATATEMTIQIGDPNANRPNERNPFGQESRKTAEERPKGGERPNAEDAKNGAAQDSLKSAKRKSAFNVAEEIEKEKRGDKPRD